jgi:hypothetical protein
MNRIAMAAGALAALLAGGAARADEGLTTRSAVGPMNDAGRLVGCQAPFEVVRADPEYSAGRRVRVNGRLSVISPPGSGPAVMLQLSVHGPDDAEDADGSPPLALVLTDGGRDSAGERLSRTAQPDEGDFVLYSLGSVTEAALRGIVADGRFSLAYTLREGGRPAPLTVDLTVKRREFGGAGERDPGAPQAFAECLRRLRLDSLTH